MVVRRFELDTDEGWDQFVPLVHDVRNYVTVPTNELPILRQEPNPNSDEAKLDLRVVAYRLPLVLRFETNDMYLTTIQAADQQWYQVNSSAPIDGVGTLGFGHRYSTMETKHFLQKTMPISLINLRQSLKDLATNPLNSKASQNFLRSCTCFAESFRFDNFCEFVAGLGDETVFMGEDLYETIRAWKKLSLGVIRQDRSNFNEIFPDMTLLQARNIVQIYKA